VRPSDTVDCCPHAAGQARSANDGGLADPPGADLAERVCHLYLCQELSTYRIAAIEGISRQRVGRMLRRAGVLIKPRGAGRRRTAADPAVVAALKDLYLRFRFTSGQIASLTGIPDRTVRDRLRAAGVTMRSRGRCNREDRQSVPADALADLYVRAGLTAAETGSTLGVHRRVVLRTAHDLDLPVRLGGPTPRSGPTEIELVDALYGDPMVRRVIARHGLPRVPAAGPISRRFPVPLALNPELAAELYDECGLGLRHIELLTGQPGDTIRAMLHRYGIRLRGPGGRSPFLRRWRSDSNPEIEKPRSKPDRRMCGRQVLPGGLPVRHIAPASTGS
jgi:hypothetical protein